jgi:hypothetical protein
VHHDRDENREADRGPQQRQPLELAVVLAIGEIIDRADAAHPVERHDRALARASESHRRQCEVIAQSLDELIAELSPRVALPLRGVEVLARRFIAILMYEEGFSWDDAAHVELRPSHDMIPRELATAALKESALRRKAAPSSRRGGGGGSSSSAAASSSGGGGHRRAGKARGRKGGGSSPGGGGSKHSVKGSDGASKKGAGGARRR